jgi:hypothetical protein
MVQEKKTIARLAPLFQRLSRVILLVLALIVVRPLFKAVSLRKKCQSFSAAKS